MNLDENTISDVDEVRGFINRSVFINETLRQKVENIRENGGIIGQV